MKIIISEFQFRKIINEVAPTPPGRTIMNAEDYFKQPGIPSEWKGYGELDSYVKDIPIFTIDQIESGALEGESWKINGKLYGEVNPEILSVTTKGGYKIHRMKFKKTGDSGIWEVSEVLLPEAEITYWSQFPEKICKNGPKSNACLNWKDNTQLKKVGKFNDTTGIKRKEGCKDTDKKKRFGIDITDTNKYLFGCSSNPYEDDAYLHPDAAQSLKIMSKVFGEDITSSNILQSAYRDFYHQANASSGDNPKASPGKSNHGLGLAIDIADGRAKRLMKKFGPAFGWCWFGSGDRVHFNYFPELVKQGKKVTCTTKSGGYGAYKAGREAWDKFVNKGKVKIKGKKPVGLPASNYTQWQKIWKDNTQYFSFVNNLLPKK